MNTMCSVMGCESRSRYANIKWRGQYLCDTHWLDVLGGRLQFTTKRGKA